LMTNKRSSRLTKPYRSPLIDRVVKHECRLVNGKVVNYPYSTDDKRVMLVSRQVAVIDTDNERNDKRMELKEKLYRDSVKPNDKGVFSNDNGMNPFEKLIKWSDLD